MTRFSKYVCALYASYIIIYIYIIYIVQVLNGPKNVVYYDGCELKWLSCKICKVSFMPLLLLLFVGYLSYFYLYFSKHLAEELWQHLSLGPFDCCNTFDISCLIFVFNYNPLWVSYYFITLFSYCIIVHLLIVFLTHPVFFFAVLLL